MLDHRLLKIMPNHSTKYANGLWDLEASTASEDTIVYVVNVQQLILTAQEIAIELQLTIVVIAWSVSIPIASPNFMKANLSYFDQKND